MPKTKPRPSEFTKRFGAAFKAIREGLGLDLQHLIDALAQPGVTRAAASTYLHEVEAGQSRIDLGDASKLSSAIAQAYARRSSHLTPLEERRILRSLLVMTEGLMGRLLPLSVTRASDPPRRVIVEGTHNDAFVYSDLIRDDFIGERMVVLRFAPRQGKYLAEDPILHAHLGEEALYCLTGSIEFHYERGLGIRNTMLQSGDVVWMDSATPHMFRFLSDSPSAEAIVAYYVPTNSLLVETLGENGKRAQTRTRKASFISPGSRRSTFFENTISGHINILRERAQSKYREVNDYTGISHSYVNKIEKRSISPHLDAIDTLMEVFDLRWTDILRSDPVRIHRGLNAGVSTSRPGEERKEHSGAYHQHNLNQPKPLCNGTGSHITAFEAEYTGGTHPLSGRAKRNSTELKLAHHVAQEGIYVLEGKLHFFWYPRLELFLESDGGYSPSHDEQSLSELERIRKSIKRDILDDLLLDSLFVSDGKSISLSLPVADVVREHAIELSAGDFIYFDSSRIYHFGWGEQRTKALILEWRPTTGV